MLDILSSPLRGYIAQNLQFYLSKYIEGIQLEGLGLFGGDLVLNDLEIKRHVLMESLEIPSAFDFSRGFIRELRIHIPWTQLLSQPIEVKLYTIELILTARSNAERRVQRAVSSDPSAANAKAGAEPEPKIEQPKSGWLHDSLQRILANISIQVNNLVLKYEQDDIVLSVALGTLDVYSASAEKDWKRSFEEPQGAAQAICKRIDVKDMTIFLDRYTCGSSGAKTAGVYRKVVGYEVPVLTRTSVSARARIVMKPRAAAAAAREAIGDADTASSSSASAVDLPVRPSTVCDPFFLYSCHRSKIKPMYEVDVFVGELTFSLSDRQLQMIAQLVRIASTKVTPPANTSGDALGAQSLQQQQQQQQQQLGNAQPSDSTDSVGSDPARGQLAASSETAASEPPTSKASWLGWAMNVLGGSDDETEDALESEIIAETKQALLRANTALAAEAAAAKAENKDGPFSLVSCVRLCIRTVSLTLRKHAHEQGDEASQTGNNDTRDSSSSANTAEQEEFVPVANLGLVRVPVQATKSRVSRAAAPLCALHAHYVALEGIIVQGAEQQTDVVLEVERVELLAAAPSDNQRSSSSKADTATATSSCSSTLFQWGSVDTAAFANCVSHPYFISSFFGDESRQLNRRETRSFELVKVSFDTEIPVWKTLESRAAVRDDAFDFQAPCACAIVWRGVRVACPPTAALYRVCQDVARAIGLKERTLDARALMLALTTAAARHDIPVRDSERLEHAVTSIASEYRQLRSADVSAAENLQQLLEPQVFALLARQTLHTCGAESLASSCRSSDIRRRSVHSAVRLRLSSSSRGSGAERSTDLPQSTSNAANTRSVSTSRVVDVSLSQADASLDPSRYRDILELLTGFVDDIVVVQPSESSVASAGSSKPSSPSAIGGVTELDAPRTATSVVLVTLSKLQLGVSSVNHPQQQQQFAAIALLVRDVVFSASTDGPSVSRSLSVGELAASCSPRLTDSVGVPKSVVQVVGLECAMRDVSSGTDDSNSDDANHKRRGSLAIDRVMASMSDDGALYACVTLDRCLNAACGRSLLRDHTRNESPAGSRSRVFRLDVCGVRASLSQSSVWGLDVLAQRALEAEIRSLSLSSSSSFVSEPTRLCAEFHSGMSPLATAVDAAGESDYHQHSGAAPFVTLSLTDQRTAGASIFVPLLPPRLLLSSVSSDAKKPSHVPMYRLRVAAAVADIETNLSGVVRAASAVMSVHNTLRARWAHRRQDAHCEPLPPITSRATASHTDALEPAAWQLAVSLSLAGGLARVNECVELAVPVITVSSRTERTAGGPHAAAGGNVTLLWSCGDARVSMQPGSTDRSNGDSAQPLRQHQQQITALEGLRGQVTYAHRVDKRQHTHTIEGDVHVSRVCAEVSRLTLHYLQKLPSMPRPRGAASRPPVLPRTAHDDPQRSTCTTSASSAAHRWSFKVGAQLDELSVKLCGDVETILSGNDTTRRPVMVEIEARISDVSTALRLGSHRPTKNSPRHTQRGMFADVQVSVGDIAVHEMVRYQVRGARLRFGDFSALTEHDLFGTLLCLDDSDLLSVMAAFGIGPHKRASLSVPSPMRTWQLTNQIVKAFRTESGRARASLVNAGAAHSSPTVIPLLTSWSRSREKSPRVAPLVSGFFRNYGDNSERQRLVAASIESLDVALTTSSMYCVASLLDTMRWRQSPINTGGSETELNSQDTSEGDATASSRVQAAIASEPTTRRPTALEDLQVSIVAGQMRLILPSESLSKSLANDDASCSGNAMLVVESASVLSSAWSEISLDGLGYPPFNATKLPRRQRPVSQRLGEARHRLWCKVGKVFGVVSDFAWSRDGSSSSSVAAEGVCEGDNAGSFEHFLSQQRGDDSNGRGSGQVLRARATETFLLPFNIAVDVEESGNSDAPSQRRAALAITKVRLEVRKCEYDVLVARVAASLRALGCLLASRAWKVSVLSPQQQKQQHAQRLPWEPGSGSLAPLASSTHVVYDVSSDGIEVALSNGDASMHVRVGSVRVLHNSSDASGSFSVQNIVAGLRDVRSTSSDAGSEGSSASPSLSPSPSSEELVFGVYADPGLWQLRADNYPEKLLSGRWNCVDSKERTVFLDLQSSQLHVSVHLLEQLQRFVQCSVSSQFSRRVSVRSAASSATALVVGTTATAAATECKLYTARRKTTVKMLIAPSVVSLWERTLPGKNSDLATSVWLTCGQVFASVGIGAESWSSRRKVLAAHGDAVHALNQFFAVRETEFMLNIEKVAVRASSDFPVLGIDFRVGTAGSLPSHVSSTWTNFSRHVHSGSARLRLLNECTLRATGDLNTVLEQAWTSHGEIALTVTPLSRMHLQCELSAIDVKISSYSVESLASILGAVQRSVNARPRGECPRSSADLIASMSAREQSTVAAAAEATAPERLRPSTDDFNYLRRVAEARHPAPGELVLTESLFIETGNSSEALLQARQAETAVQVDELAFSNYEQIEEDDLLAFVDEVNAPWELDSSEPPGDAAVSGLPPSAFENRTMSWMGMRWCYHIPRVIDEIVANPVPIPPTGMPSGWPIWHGGAASSADARSEASGRLCDIFCQLRCWDARSNRFVIVSEFFAPWERSASGPYRLDAAQLYEPESFGDFVTQWFEEDMADYAYHGKLLELASAARRVRFRGGPPSDKWELRWRSPMSIDMEAEHKQKRLLVNALLASSIRVSSMLCTDAFQRAVVGFSAPRIDVSLCHVSLLDYAHEVISAGLKDTVVTLATCGESHRRELDVTVSTALHVYVQNFVQLLNVSVLPQVSIHGRIHAAPDGVEVSTIVDPVELYLSHTAMLILSTLDTILGAGAAAPQRADDEPRQLTESQTMATQLLLHDMRITVVNEASHKIWCRQESTSECLVVQARSSAAYSWLTLASSAYYRMEFAVEPEVAAASSSHVEAEASSVDADTHSVWSDPCVIKHNGVTGRYFRGRGFLWVCVELRGLQTVVTLRPSVIFRNFCSHAVHVRLNDEQTTTYACDAQQSESPHTDVDVGADAASLAPAQSRGSSAAFITTDAAFRVRVSQNGTSWSAPFVLSDLPPEFGLVRSSSDAAASDRKEPLDASRGSCWRGGKRELVTLRSADAGRGSDVCGWLVARRAECRAVLPNDFDPNQRQLAQRYTWLELSLWPALAVENTTDVAVAFVFTQQRVTVRLHVDAHGAETIMSTINPFEAAEITAEIHATAQDDAASTATPTTCKFSLRCSRDALAEQLFDFGTVRFRVLIPASSGGDDATSASPTITLRVERGASVENVTDAALHLRVSYPATRQQSSVVVAAGASRQISMSSKDEVVVLEVGVRPDAAYANTGSESTAADVHWSSPVRLSTRGDTKPCIVAFQLVGSEANALAGSYLIELAREPSGAVRIAIRPQVVILNTTGMALRLLPISSEGESLMSETNPAVVATDSAAWCAPVCLSTFKKRSLTSDVASWLSSTFSRRPSEDVDVSKVRQPAKLSCAFRVALEDTGSEWTDEIVLKLPDLAMLVSLSGAVEITESPDVKHARSGKLEPVYPAPSTLSRRHRILVRRRDGRHRMLTYTIARVGSCIHVLFFIDQQSPVVLHNQWNRALGFRALSSPSFPEAVGAQHYMEYDWDLQTQRSRPLTGAIDGSSAAPGDLDDWLASSANAVAYNSSSSSSGGDSEDERVRFQIGSPAFGWSNTLWQVGGIQFATFVSHDSAAAPTFLVMCSRRAGTWYISTTCLEDPLAQRPDNPVATTTVARTTAPLDPVSSAPHRQRPRALTVCVSIAELRFHCCDEFDPVRDVRGLIQYPEIFRLRCSSATVVYSSSPEPPESSRASDRLGYLAHVRAYSSLFVAVEDIEFDHFLQDCNFPVILSFPGNEARHAARELRQLELSSKHGVLRSIAAELLSTRMPLAAENCLVARVIFVDTWERNVVPAYFHSVQVSALPAVLQVEDAMLSYVHDFAQPLLHAIAGARIVSRNDRAAAVAARPEPMHNCRRVAPSWVLASYAAMRKTSQRRVFISVLELSAVELTVTARVSIPIVNSFDGTPVRFGAVQMRDVFAFTDQLVKDLAADYVADAIVRSPMLLMSLNILGNPAGFFRSVGTGVRDLFEMPLAAARDGYNPWTLTKGVVGGVSSFCGHTTAAVLTSLSGFSYSVSRTVEQLTLPSEQLKQRHYTRPTHLSSALADGLGSLGSSVVGAAAGVITTPIAIYKERKEQGLETRLGDVVGGVGMGLVGIVARPMGGVASLVSRATDGILYGSGMGDDRLLPLDDVSTSRFDARPNEILRYKLKVLADVVADVVYAHGVWVAPPKCMLVVDASSLHYFQAPRAGASMTSDADNADADALRQLLVPEDRERELALVTVLLAKRHVYMIGESGASKQVVLAKTQLTAINAVEETLTEPSRMDLGVQTAASRIEWLRFRLVPSQRRRLSHRLREWMADDGDVHGAGF